MRQLNVANDKKRDAIIGMDNVPFKHNLKFVLSNGEEQRNIKILRGTLETSIDKLSEQFDDLIQLGEEIIQSDPEVDIELFGKILNTTRKLFLNAENEIVYRVQFKEIVYNPDGTIKEEHDVEKRVTNITENVPLKWTGKTFPKEAAIRKFVFSKKYQLKHVNGLTYDFLFDMAKTLQESNSLMLVGTGSKGLDPIILTTGGEPHRGFLEGRIQGEQYCLILHLTKLELKKIPNEN